MSMFDTFNRSWELAKLSWNVLMQDKELLFFPILSGIGAVLMFILIVVPAAFIPASATLTDTPTGTAIAATGSGITWVSILIAYFAAAFVTIFMSAALIACVKKRLSGGDPNVWYGLKEASKRILPILLWSIIATSVGMLLRALSNKSREQGGITAIIGQLVVSIIGFAWTIITMFVLPVIVMERLSVIDSIKRAVQLVKKTWGEQVVMNISIGLAFGYIYVSLIVIAIISIFVMPFFFVPLIIIFILLFIVIIVFQVTLNGIFTAVLYSYAAGDNIPLDFKQQMNAVFSKPKNSLSAISPKK